MGDAGYPLTMASRRRQRPLVALQVEVSSRCTRRCTCCPRTVLADRWQEGDLGFDLWQRVRPDLNLVHHLRLQGWGEPLLHPKLEEMAGDCAAAGCEVGITTNGDLVRERGGWLANGEVHIVTMSVAGAGEANKRWRDGVPAETVWTAMEILASARRRRTPRLQVSFLLTADNAAELPDAVRNAALCGADEVFVVHLDYTPTAWLLEAQGFSNQQTSEPTRQILDRSARLARRHGITLRAPTLIGREMIACDLDPTVMASMSWDGRVGPCVHLTMPLTGRIPRATQDGELVVQPVVFGNLGDRSLASILDGQTRRAFIAPFTHRAQAERRFRNDITSLGWGSPALARLDEVETERTQSLNDHPFPPACTGCHKAWGW